MRLIDRHIFTEWAKVFILTLLVIMGLLLIVDIQDDLGNLVGYGASIWEILRYYATLTPSFLPAVIPITILVSLLFSLGQLHRNFEIVAMRSAGISVWKISRVLWVSGALLALILLWLNAQVVPWSVESARTQWNNLHFRAELAADRDEEEVGLVPNLTFHHAESGRLWFINSFNEFNYRAYGITVSQFDSQRRETRRILANQGYFDEINGFWIFLDGRQLFFDSASGNINRSLAFDRLEEEALTDDPTLMQFLKRRPQDLSFWQLTRVIQSLEGHDNQRVIPYQVRYYSVLFNPLSALIVVGIAIPFALAGVRTNPMVGVAKSIGLFLLYYLISNVSAILGGTLLSPAMAALLPNLCMIGVALLLAVRAMKPA